MIEPMYFIVRTSPIRTEERIKAQSLDVGPGGELSLYSEWAKITKVYAAGQCETVTQEESG